MSGHRARRRFGQNFLHDENVIERIIGAINPQSDQHLVEIGPGQGALTRRLLASDATLTVIEIDRDLVAAMQQDPIFGRAEIVSADALTVDLSEIAGTGSIRLLGNLPYNVSTPLLFHALSFADHIEDMHFMLQKEVVDRMASGPGSKQYGRLSVMLQYHCSVEPLFVVKPGSFRPIPKVDSAVVRLVPRKEKDPLARDETVLSQVVTAAFSKRRKTLSNALKGLMDADALRAIGIDPGIRAEQLPVEQFVAIANSMEPQ